MDVLTPNKQHVGTLYVNDFTYILVLPSNTDGHY